MRLSTRGTPSECVWIYFVAFYSIWVLLLIFCPHFTNTSFHPSANLHVFLVPHATVSRCPDGMSVFCLLRARWLHASGFVLPFRRPITLLMLLILSGNVELNPGPTFIQFAHLNTNSITSVTVKHDKPALLCDFISDYNVELMSLCETHLTDSALPSDLASFTPEGFHLVHKPCSLTPAGGLAFIFRPFLKLAQIETPNYTSFENLFAGFTTAGQSFKILNIYRSPSLSKSVFLAEFASLLEIIVSSPSEIVITGDVNIHVDDIHDPYAVKFLKLLDSFNLRQLVDFPTHNQGHTLDHLICRKTTDFIKSVEWVVPFLSDHFAILSSFAVASKSRSPIITKCFRRLNKINMHSFKADLLSSSLFVSPATTLDSLTAQFWSTLASVLDKHAPLVKITCHQRKPKPFVNTEIRSEKKYRSRLESKYRRSRSETDLAAWKTQAKKVSELITSSRRSFYRSLIAKFKDKPRNLWSSLNDLLSRKLKPCLPSLSSLSETTAAFLNYFNDKIVKLNLKLPPAAIDPHMPPPCEPPRMEEFALSSPEEITKIVMASSDATCILDPIPTKILKLCIDILAEPLSLLVNMALSEGCFPELFRTAVVTPLIKKSGLPHDDLSNYRPISNLSFISKLLERIVNNRITSHIDSFSVFTPFQSAYRKFHSTETALLRIENDILLAMDKQQVTALVLLDLSAAFDTVDHDILLHRLQCWFGISGSVLKFLSSYLSCRSQSILIDGISSSSLPLKTGVPQGSVLGPLLFILYTSPLANLISSMGLLYHLYADDTQLYVSFAASDKVDNLQKLSVALDKVHEWFTANRLSLNPGKTEYLLMGTWQQRQKVHEHKINFCGNVLKSVDSARNLGVIFDTSMSFKKQISKVCQISFMYIRQLRRIRPFLDRNSAIMLANALVSSRIDYCNSLYYDLPKASIERLQRVQNSLARVVVCSVRRTDHITPTLKTLHWLPVEKRIEFKIASLTYKILSSNKPSYLDSLITQYKPVRSLRSADKQTLVIPTIKSANGRRSFSFASPTIWNSLPLDIRSTASLLSFRKKLKHHLFPP